MDADWQNKLYFGDNLEILRDHVGAESVDLIYLDPPFNSKATYSVLFKEKNGTASAAQQAAPLRGKADRVGASVFAEATPDVRVPLPQCYPRGYSALIIVPMPVSVNSSISRAWGVQPSIMWARSTPPATA